MNEAIGDQGVLITMMKYVIQLRKRVMHSCDVDAAAKNARPNMDLQSSTCMWETKVPPVFALIAVLYVLVTIFNTY